MMLGVLAIASLCYLVLHFAFYWVQFSALLPLQQALIGDLAPALLVFPIHGLRVLCAWAFGLWSIVIMAPTALAIVATHHFLMGYDTTSLAYVIMALTYLTSAPLSFHLIKTCLGKTDDHMAVEWRVIMLTGFLSGLINVMVAGLLLPYSSDGRDMMLWLLAKLVGYMSGIFVLLLLILMALRVARHAVQRVN